MARHNPTVQEKMFNLIRQQAEGSETVKAFCERHDISISVFHYWSRKLRAADKVNDGAFVRLEVSGADASPKLNWYCVRAGGLSSIRK